MNRPAYFLFGVVVAAGVAARLGLLLILPERSWPGAALPDEVQYWQAAESLASGEGLEDELGFRAGRMPLYPAYLALFAHGSSGRLWALVIQAVFGSLAGGWIALLMRQLTADHPQTKWLAIIAGLCTALDPFQVYFSRFLLTETFFTAALCGLYWWCRPMMSAAAPVPLSRWVGAGVWMALAIYLKPSVVWFGPLLAVTMFLFCNSRKKVILGIICSSATVLLLLVPWAWRNEQLLGRWVWLTTRRGISLYDGVHPHATGASDLGKIKLLPDVRQLSELEYDQYFQTASLTYIRREPGRIVRLAGIKFLRTWSLWPNAEGYRAGWMRWIAGSWMVLLLSSLVAGLVRWRAAWRMLLWLLLPVIYFTLLHMLFVGSVRYRLPVMPLVGMIAALGWFRPTADLPMESAATQSTRH
ncbi:MAG: hypothetical protein HJJLKODD_01476 [Phycisphaerae bacterium]|nr:hypothetical protein [Phycisphaerae bacterium]